MARSASSIAMVAIALAHSVQGAAITHDPAEFASRPYNYIIVGGGTAGLAIAARLSEDSNRIVGVIEAGPHLPDDPLIYTPALFGRAQSNPTYDWMLATTPQAALYGRSINLPRGKVLGGSSALNYMAYDRASSKEYDAWYPFSGSGWKWENFLPWIKKAENTLAPTVATPFGDPLPISSFQGSGGPVQKSYNTWYSDATKPYLDTLNNLGIAINPRPDDGNATGVYNCPVSVNRQTGKRSYAANTYYTQAQDRPNLHVLLGGEVTKLNFKGRSVKNVTFAMNGTQYTAPVTNEVILSAGTLKTPQILELSGIGQKSLLQSLGIPVIRDLPGVGENLQDHLLIANSFALKPGFTTFDILRNNVTFQAAQQALYDQTGTGIYAATHSAFAFFGLNKFLPDSVINALTAELEQELNSASSSPMSKKQFAIMKEWLPGNTIGQLELIFLPRQFGPTPPAANTSYVSILAAIQHPWSRGSVHINSTIATAPPIIDPHYLERSFDAKLLAYGSQFARKIAQTEPLAQHIANLHDPASTVVTDQDFLNYTRSFVGPVQHPIGTAAMGDESFGGVVSNRLIVHGTSNLRVADASVIPMHIATHLQQTVYGIAEKAASMIKEDNANE